MTNINSEIDRIYVKTGIAISVLEYIALRDLINPYLKHRDRDYLKDILKRPYLSEHGLIAYHTSRDIEGNLIDTIEPTQKCKKLLKLTNKEVLFERLFNAYPETAVTKSGNRILRRNIDKCRRLFIKFIQSDEQFEVILECLEREKKVKSIDEYKYMKTLENWLKSEEYKNYLTQ